MSPRQAFHELLNQVDFTVPASVFDPLTARMAEKLSYRAAILPGSAVALHHLGLPDISLITADQVIDLARRITRRLSLPLIVDGDHGFGNALNVHHFVESLGLAGVAAVTIEDTLLPRSLAAGAAKGIHLAEACTKLRAAVAAAADNGPLIIGRTSLAVCPDSASMITRLKAFEDCGVSALFVSGLEQVQMLESIVAATRLPLVLGVRGAALQDDTALQAAGVRLALSCRSTSSAAYQAAYAALKDNAHGATTADENIGSVIAELSMSTHYQSMAERYSYTNSSN